MKQRDEVIAEWIKQGRDEDRLWVIALAIEGVSFNACVSKDNEQANAARYELSVLCSLYNEVYTEDCLRNEALSNTLNSQ